MSSGVVAAGQRNACLHHRIAGVDFLVYFPAGIFVNAPVGTDAQFVVQQPAGRDAIRVDVVVGEMPCMASWRALVSHGPTWSVRQNEEQRCVCVGDPFVDWSAGRIACWQTDVRHAVIYCAPDSSAAAAGTKMCNPLSYPVDQLLLIYYLACREGLLVHAAGLVVDGQALIFPGVSGAGKSTLARQFLARGRSNLLSDDRVVVRGAADRNVAFGTPWPGDARVATNASASLAAILFPSRGAETHIRKLSAQSALDRLLPATSILWYEPELLSCQLATCEHLLRHIPAFELSWSPSIGIVDDVQEFMRHL
jgi:hypothetical protein